MAGNISTKKMIRNRALVVVPEKFLARIEGVDLSYFDEVLMWKGCLIMKVPSNIPLGPPSQGRAVAF